MFATALAVKMPPGETYTFVHQTYLTNQLNNTEIFCAIVYKKIYFCNKSIHKK